MATQAQVAAALKEINAQVCSYTKVERGVSRNMIAIVVDGEQVISLKANATNNHKLEAIAFAKSKIQVATPVKVEEAAQAVDLETLVEEMKQDADLLALLLG